MLKNFYSIFLFLLFIPFFGFNSLLNAQDFFVALSGNDKNPGTEIKPWRTIQKAANAAEPGSTVYVKGGIYKEKIIVNVQGNEKNGYITFRNFGSDQVVISGAGVSKKSGVDSDNIFYIQNKSYIKIIGFEIRDIKAVEGSGIRFWGAGNHIEIRNNVIHEIRGGGLQGGAMGITIYGANDQISIHDLIIDGNEIYNCDPACSEALTLNGNIESFEVTNNKVHDVNNIGIDFIGGESWISKQYARNGICRGNLVYQAHSNYEDGYAAGIYVDGGSNILIESNQVFQCDMGIEVGAENKGVISTGIHLQNNYLHHNDKAGLVFGGYDSGTGRVKNCLFTYNTLENNDTFGMGHGEIWIQFASDNLISHNTIKPGSQNLALYSEQGSVNNTCDYNNYYSPKGVENILFVWKNKQYKGLSKFRSGTGQEGHAVIQAEAPLFFSALQAPTHLAAKNFSETEIELSWDNKTINETAFKIERSLDNQFFELVGKVPENTKTFKDEVQPATAYYYRIKASNSFVESDYSDTVAALLEPGSAYTLFPLVPIQAKNIYGSKALESIFEKENVLQIKGSSNPEMQIQAQLDFVLIPPDYPLPPQAKILSAELEVYCSYIEKLNVDPTQVHLFGVATEEKNTPLGTDNQNKLLLATQDILKPNQIYKYDITGYVADHYQAGKSLLTLLLEADPNADRLIQFHLNENSLPPKLIIHYHSK